jgi:hypothetical protein
LVNYYQDDIENPYVYAPTFAASMASKQIPDQVGDDEEHTGNGKGLKNHRRYPTLKHGKRVS